jgi:iron complex transport system ATP-binding protein
MTELSGGQRQRVLVARALASRAPTLLVDEPTAALDLEHQLRVFALLARLADGGRSVLVVTHDVNLASQFAARVALLDRGRVAACGSPDAVLRREVLEPVYGRHLHYGRLPGPDARPFVLPWMERS